MIECGEFTCIKTKSMIHIDWGNVEIKEGTKYKCYNLPDEEKYFFVNFFTIYFPFPKDHFSYISENRDKKINVILDGE